LCDKGGCETCNCMQNERIAPVPRQFAVRL
jgi:hypothetical protein